jgi:hypothetical protein
LEDLRQRMRRIRHALLGHGTVVARPPSANSALGVFLEGALCCKCGHQLGWWDADGNWHEIK